jgi:hypothetical protein
MRGTVMLWGGVCLAWGVSMVACATEGDSNPPSAESSTLTGGAGSEAGLRWSGGIGTAGARTSSGGQNTEAGAPAAGGPASTGGSLAIVDAGGQCAPGFACQATGTTCTGQNGTCTCVSGVSTPTWGICSYGTGGSGAGGAGMSTGGLGAGVCQRSAPCTPGTPNCTTVNGGTCRCSNSGTWGGSNCN